MGEFLDYKSCKCRNKIADKLVALNTIPLNDHKNVCNSCTIYIVSFAVFFITSICISSIFIYFHWYLKKDKNRTYYFFNDMINIKDFDTNNHTKILAFTILNISLLKVLVIVKILIV